MFINKNVINLVYRIFVIGYLKYISSVYEVDKILKKLLLIISVIIFIMYLHSEILNDNGNNFMELYIFSHTIL